MKQISKFRSVVVSFSFEKIRNVVNLKFFLLELLPFFVLLNFPQYNILLINTVQKTASLADKGNCHSTYCQSIGAQNIKHI